VRRAGALVAVVAALAVPGCGDQPVPVGRRTTPDRVRSALADTGLGLRYFAARASDGITPVTGVATGRDGTRVGFEFAIAGPDRPTVRVLGGWRFPVRFTSKGDYFTTDEVNVPGYGFVTADVRGVAGNLAYANYLIGRAGSGGIVRVPTDAEARVMRRLDDALVASFPPDDAEVRPLARTP
jgi:hypothetical protein